MTSLCAGTRCQATHGSMVYEVFSKRADKGTPSSAFTATPSSVAAAARSLSAPPIRCTHRSAYLSRDSPWILSSFLAMSTPRCCSRCAHAASPATPSRETNWWRRGSSAARKEPSLPSTMREELAYNPHLKANPDELALMCGCATEEI